MDEESFNTPASEEELKTYLELQTKLSGDPPKFKGNMEHLVKLYRVLHHSRRSSNERRDMLEWWERFNKSRKDWDIIEVGGMERVVKGSYTESLAGLDLRGLVLGNEVVGPICFAGANLRDSCFASATLTGADFSKANLQGASFAGNADTGGSPAWLLRSNFSSADLSGCNFSGVMLADSQFTACHSSGKTVFEGADLQGANFNNANLSGANMRGVNLQLAQLSETDLRGADLSGSDIYGATVVEPKTDATTKQEGLRVTPTRPAISVNRSRRISLVAPRTIVPDLHTKSLEHGNLLYLMGHTDLAALFGATTEKGVLLLGRFEGEHGKVLDELRTQLRNRGFLPMKFDFKKPGDRTLKETVVTLAGLSHFVIADITEASSVGLELATIAREFRIPIVPIMRKGRKTFSMFESFVRDYREQVLDPLEYEDVQDLIEVIEPAIIKRAEAHGQQMQAMKSHPIRQHSTSEFAGEQKRGGDN